MVCSNDRLDDAEFGAVAVAVAAVAYNRDIEEQQARTKCVRPTVLRGTRGEASVRGCVHSVRVRVEKI